MGDSQKQLQAMSRAFHEMRWRVHRYQQELQRKQKEIEEANAALRDQNDRLRHANEILERLSITDELTRLYNLRYFREQLPRELKRALRTGQPLALVLFDIDDFKRLNDRYGHAVGDAVLARVAEVMCDQVRQTDLLARYGGEEFVLLASQTSVDGAVALAEKIRMAVGRSRFPIIELAGRTEIEVTVSAGVAAFRGDDRMLFADADRALYRAKAAGKDCVAQA